MSHIILVKAALLIGTVKKGNSANQSSLFFTAFEPLLLLQFSGGRSSLTPVVPSYIILVIEANESSCELLEVTMPAVLPSIYYITFSVD